MTDDALPETPPDEWVEAMLNAADEGSSEPIRWRQMLAAYAALCEYVVEKVAERDTHIVQRAEIARLRAALEWCGGSPDFNEGGQAEEGWRRLCAPLLADQGDGE